RSCSRQRIMACSRWSTSARRRPSRPLRGSPMRAIRVHEFGGPEAMRLEELPTPKPGDGQALVRLEAAGVNFIDVYQRSGLYKNPLPYSLGLEGAGVVEAGGPGVTTVHVGGRVPWTGVPGAEAPPNGPPADPRGAP